MDERVPVANRYFGAFQDGTLKVRGIESCRHDTPPFIARAQMAILERFATALDASQLVEHLPAALDILRKSLSDLRKGKVPPKDLLVAQKLSRTLDKYHSPSPAARAVAQLQAVGKEVQPGQQVRFLYTRGEPGVLAWDLPACPEPSQLDVTRYSKLLLRAAVTVLQPLGVDEETLRDWLYSNAGYNGQPGKITGKETRFPMPLLFAGKGYPTNFVTPLDVEDSGTLC
jgi:DNA polymerase-2